jgi:hypothetical protein
MEEWNCGRCGDAFFGIPPECGLCIACQEEIGETPMVVRARVEARTELFTGREEELRVAEEQRNDEIRSNQLDGRKSGPP